MSCLETRVWRSMNRPRCVAVRGVDFAPDADEHAARTQILCREDGSAAALYFLGRWQMHVVQLNRASSQQGELPLPQRAMTLEETRTALQSEGRISGATIGHRDRL